MDYQDKERYERIRETLGDGCGMVELARVDESDAIGGSPPRPNRAASSFDPDAARELVDALGADMMLVAGEMEKLCLYVAGQTKPSRATTSPWATWRRWCWRPSSARSTN